MRIVKGLNNPELDAAVGEDLAQQLRDELELVQGASNEFDHELFSRAKVTPRYSSVPRSVTSALIICWMA